MFDKLLEQCDNLVFDGWEEFKIDIIQICTKFEDIEEFRNKLKVKLEYLVCENGNDELKQYSSERMLAILYEIIEKYESKENSEEFIIKNIGFTSFKELYINKFMEEKNYLKVIDLALEWETKDKRYSGLVFKWKKMRYIAYKKLSLNDEQEKLATELLINGEFDYYTELEELHKDNIDGFYISIKEELKKNKGFNARSIYLKLIVLKDDIDEIMDYVRDNPQYIGEYAEMIVGKYRDEVVSIYRKYIKSRANVATNRKQYQGVCSIIKRYTRLAGKSNLKEIVNDISMLFKNKPAFLDELSKLK